MKKQGFISVSVLYSFLIVFLLLLVSIAASYVTKDNLVTTIVNDAKEELL